MLDKKKLKETYKNIVPAKGIFVIKNNKTGKVFLGSSLNLAHVFNRNKFVLNLGSHKNKHLQKDWSAFGEETFSFEILETLKISEEPNYDYDEDLKILELIWIEKYRPFSQNCYNENENIRMV